MRYFLGEPTAEAKAEVARKIAAARDAMSPEERAEHETTRRFRNKQADEEYLAALSPEERERELERREAFRDRMQTPTPIKLRHETILDTLARGVQHEALGAEAALRAARQRNFRRPKPRADGC